MINAKVPLYQKNPKAYFAVRDKLRKSGKWHAGDSKGKSEGPPARKRPRLEDVEPSSDESQHITIADFDNNNNNF